MSREKELDNLVSRIKTHDRMDFDRLALAVFRYQRENNPIYSKYIELLGKDVSDIDEIHQIPFLPISTFKTNRVITGNFEPEIIFESSGTTGSVASKHHVRSLSLYEHSFMKSFSKQYGDPSEMAILSLLPSYLERGGSSLVYMADKLMQISDNPENGFFLDEFDILAEKIKKREASGLPTLLLGVSYALLDFGEAFPMQLNHTIIMETGGMKGRRKELSKIELHEKLGNLFGVEKIHSEYGMTEMMSQAYSTGDGIFEPGVGLKLLIRREDDPFDVRCTSKENNNPLTGGVNIIDLHNIHSCSFIATEDLGRLHPNGSFEILGRLENSETRGCGLMYML
jgi:phenylacetate-coenzyme A ligase PaaK-like adenylate-forming protein